MIEAKELKVCAGKTILLERINFSAACGSITAIMGANGSGKSTLLKALSGTIPLQHGEVLYDGKNIFDLTLWEQSAIRAVLTQNNSTEIPFKVSEVVMMGRYARFGRKPGSWDLDCVDMAMKTTGVAHLANRPFAWLSGGEKQRVHLARVLAQVWEAEKGYLLLDEPITGLDIYYQHQMMDVFAAMAAKNFGVVCVLHDLNLALQYASDVLLLKEGTQLTYSPAAQALSPELVAHAYGVDSRLIYLPSEHRKIVYFSGVTNTFGHKAHTV